MNVSSAPSVQRPSPSGPARRWRLAAAASLVLIGVTIHAVFGDQLTFARVAESEARLRDLVRLHPVQTSAVIFLIYVAAVGLSFPGAWVMTPLVGWLFGFWRGLLLASFAASVGGTLAFLLSRYLLRDFVQRRWGERLSGVHSALERDGAYYLLTLRLVPAFPFFVVNLVMGLTRIPVWTFYWVSQLGMLPGAAAFVLAGTNFPPLKELADSPARLWNWPLVLTLTAVGLLPLALRNLLKLSQGTTTRGEH